VKTLVVTSLGETFGKNEEIVFAGDWIKSNLNFEKDFEHRKYEFFDYRWSDEENLKNTFSYLYKLRSKLLEELSSNLNFIHKTNYPLKFWKIIINPWLHYYLEETYVRFEIIKKILNKKENLNFIYYNELKNFETPFDVRDFLGNIRRSDIYNQFIFQKIIKYFSEIKKNNHLKLIYEDKKINKDKSTKFLYGSDKINYLRKFISFFLKSITKKNKFFLDVNSIGINFILLNFKLKQIPFRDYEFFTNDSHYKLFKNKSTHNPQIRKNFTFEFDKQNDYENFLNINFYQDIPKSLVEDFFMIKNFVAKIPYKPQTIVSDVRHEHDTIFKFWLADKVRNGSKLITSDHGGTYGVASYKGKTYQSIVNEDIADISVRWFKPIEKNNIQLPALQLLNKKRLKNKKKRKHLLTIGFGGTKYPKNIFLGPISAQTLYQVNYIEKFYKNLNQKLKDNFLFRPIPDDDWKIGQRIEKILEKKQLVLSKKQYLHYFNRSKIIVCSYAKTAFCEAMVSGPTILLYKPEVHKNRDEFRSLHANLQKAHILFEDPLLASKHLNNIWDNVDDWWESKDVKSAREFFINEVALVQPKALNIWKNFLTHL
tara:strand:+ start:1930 stop:3717 length:1788 start_codon:yes stop_codon:yes gene_type:complete